MASFFNNVVADQIAHRLAVYLGTHTSRIALRTFALKAVQRTPEELTPRDVPALCIALRPMLQTFVGREWTEVILTSIEREFES